MVNDRIKVKILGLTRVIFEGEVIAFSSKNIKGNFDILPDHTNYITIINDAITLVFADNTQKQIPADLGIVRCLNDEIEVYLGINVASAQMVDQQLQASKQKQEQMREQMKSMLTRIAHPSQNQ